MASSGKILLSSLLLVLVSGCWSLQPEEWCVTQLEAKDLVEYRWSVQEFSLRGEQAGEPLFSPSMGTSQDKVKWYLELYPTSSTPGYEAYISLFLCLTSAPQGQDFALFNLTILGTNGSYVGASNTAHKFTTNEPCWGYNTFITRALASKHYLDSDTLDMVVSIQRYEEATSCPQQIEASPMRRDPEQVFFTFNAVRP